MKRKFLYLLLTLCLLGQCLPAFAAQAPVLERIAFSGATIVGQCSMCAGQPLPVFYPRRRLCRRHPAPL